MKSHVTVAGPWDIMSLQIFPCYDMHYGKNNFYSRKISALLALTVKENNICWGHLILITIIPLCTQLAFMFNLPLRNQYNSWRDDSEVKSTDCSSESPELKSQQPHGGSQPIVMRSDALF